MLPIVLLLVSAALQVLAQSASPDIILRDNSRRSVPEVGFYDPKAGGGSTITVWPALPGLGEPMNAIISGNSDTDVLIDRAELGGLRNYFLSLQFSSECFGQHLGDRQMANLGDGNGLKNETAVIRYNYGDPNTGTCLESLYGGNHFRYWIQNGPNAPSGAIFLALSYEKNLTEHHDIIPNGYNIGRDFFVGNISQTAIPTLSLNNGSTFSGTTSSANYTYNTKALYSSGFMANSSVGINHNTTVPVDGKPAVDGLIAVLTVKIISRPANTTTPTSASSPNYVPLTSLLLLALATTFTAY